MALYRLLLGQHVQADHAYKPSEEDRRREQATGSPVRPPSRTYRAGEVVESDRDLEAFAPGKFQLLGSSQQAHRQADREARRLEQEAQELQKKARDLRQRAVVEARDSLTDAETRARESDDLPGGARREATPFPAGQVLDGHQATSSAYAPGREGDPNAVIPVSGPEDRVRADAQKRDEQEKGRQGDDPLFASAPRPAFDEQHAPVTGPAAGRETHAPGEAHTPGGPGRHVDAGHDGGAARATQGTHGTHGRQPGKGDDAKGGGKK